MTADTSPVVNEAYEDEDDNHDDLNHREPVLRFAWGDYVNLCGGEQSTIVHTIHSHMDKLHDEYRYDNHESILPGSDVRVPVLRAS